MLILHDCATQQCDIAATLLDQLLMAAALDDLAVIEHQDLIGVADRG